MKPRAFLQFYPFRHYFVGVINNRLAVWNYIVLPQPLV